MIIIPMTKHLHWRTMYLLKTSPPADSNGYQERVIAVKGPISYDVTDGWNCGKQTLTP